MADDRKTSIDTVTLAKACAMVLMVANHAKLSQALFGLPALYGGLNAMLAVSGISMATYAFEGDTRHTLRSFLRFGLRLALPCLAVALVWDTIILILGARDVTLLRYFAELGLFSNWLWPSKLALFPIWYVQAVVQLLAGLALLFGISNLTPRLRRSPVLVSGWMLALALAVAVASYAVWNTAGLEDRLPHLLAWNIVLGWFFWAMGRDGPLSTGRKLVLTITVLVASSVAYLPTGADHGESRAFWLPAILMPIIWWHRVRLPALVVRLVHLTAASTFVIFLMHFYVFGLIEEPLLYAGFNHPVALAVIKAVAGLAVPVLCWAWFTAFTRVMRHHRTSRPRRLGGEA